MLETLSRGFESARERLKGVQKLSEDNVDEALRDVRSSLLEADVDLGVVKDFLARVKERALGEKVATRVRDAQGRTHRITAGQHFVKVCQEELEGLMGPVDSSLARGKNGVTSVMLIGLQGVGKTTVAAKLAHYMKTRQQKRPLLVAADVHRPAAVLQLKRLGERIGVPVHAGVEGATPAGICQAAVQRARTERCDAIIFDTAGRLAIDEELMEELDEIERTTQPANRILVCDALMGRDAVNVAKAFRERLDLDGVILTKLDGDARGGAALAVKAVTGVPIKFLGTGEDVERLEAFRPEGLASRILGMGDIVGLVEDFEHVVDEKTAEEDAERLLAGKFGMDDLLTQLRTIQKMGPLKEVFSKMPMFGGMADQADDRELVRVEAMIQSMTKAERKQPDIIDKSRAGRIARGSGMQTSQVRDLVKRFGQMRDMMSALGSGKGGGMLSRIPGMGDLAGAGAGGMDPAALLGGLPGQGSPGPSRAQQAKSRARNKKKRKQARKSRKRGRKK